LGEMEGLGRELNAHYIRHLQGSQLQFLNDASISLRFAVVAGDSIHYACKVTLFRLTTY
jgi:hypothetical protein